MADLVEPDVAAAVVAACASSPKHHQFGQRRAQPVRQTSALAADASQVRDGRKTTGIRRRRRDDRGADIFVAGWPTMTDPVTSSNERPRLVQPKLPLRT